MLQKVTKFLSFPHFRPKRKYSNYLIIKQKGSRGGVPFCEKWENIFLKKFFFIQGFNLNSFSLKGIQFFHKLWFFNPHTFETKSRGPLIFLVKNSAMIEFFSFKYQRFADSNCKDIRIRKFEIVSKISLSLSSSRTMILMRQWFWWVNDSDETMILIPKTHRGNPVRKYYTRK